MKTRVLTGIQATGIPHLGNILGAIVPAINMSEQADSEAFLFIADLHTITAVKDSETRKHNTYATAAAWLAFGFDTNKNVFYRQSDIPEVTELTWYFNCFTPFPMLANAHSFKDKSNKLADVNAGLFTYPVLMACDIVLYDAHVVPVGKDQVQHIEITRDIATAFNNTYGETFILPDAKVDTAIMTIPGTDGQKMSKSYGNTITIFASDKELKKQVMSIITDSTALEEPKNPDTCNVFKLYALMATDEQIATMRANYERGGYGYGHAKNELLQLLMTKYAKERELFNFYMTDLDALDAKLAIGAEKARAVAHAKLHDVRQKLGLKVG